MHGIGGSFVPKLWSDASPRGQKSIDQAVWSILMPLNTPTLHWATRKGPVPRRWALAPAKLDWPWPCFSFITHTGGFAAIGLSSQDLLAFNMLCHGGDSWSLPMPPDLSALRNCLYMKPPVEPHLSLYISFPWSFIYLQPRYYCRHYLLLKLVSYLGWLIAVL